MLQWRKKCTVDSVYLAHLHKVSWKQCLSLCSWRWIRPKRNLVKILFPRGLWILKTVFAQGHMKFRSFFLKILRLPEFLKLKSSLLYSERAEGKKEFLSLTFIEWLLEVSMGFWILFKLLMKLNKYEGNFLLKIL